MNVGWCLHIYIYICVQAKRVKVGETSSAESPIIIIDDDDEDEEQNGKDRGGPSRSWGGGGLPSVKQSHQKCKYTNKSWTQLARLIMGLDFTFVRVAKVIEHGKSLLCSLGTGCEEGPAERFRRDVLKVKS